MSQPVRIQRKRTKGFKMPAGSVSITRPGNWGNPFTVEEEKEELIIQQEKVDGFYSPALVEKKARERVVQKFHDMMADPYSHKVLPQIRERFIYMRTNLEQLTGKDVGCFCSLDQQCHGDVLLKLANP